MNYFLSICVGFIIFFQFAKCQECSNQTISFDSLTTSYTIQSDPNDLTPKICKYTFNVPKYFVPEVIIDNTFVNGNNKITVRQYTEYGGSKSFDSSATVIDLAPTTFSLEIDLPNKSSQDTFVIAITVKDTTPTNNDLIFGVDKDLGTLIDAEMLLTNTSLVQYETYSQTTYNMRLALFTNINIVGRLLAKIQVYDNGVYKGSLYDVFIAGNISTICKGTNFEILNGNPSSIGAFTVLISPTRGWDESKVSVIASNSVSNNSQTLSATDGKTVFQEITNRFIGTVTPTRYRQISFRGDGELIIYAGCVTGDQEQNRVATITPSNAADYENLMVFGRCKTYVLNKGVLQWVTSRDYKTDYKHKDGGKGVIMSNNYPYSNDGGAYRRNYLIQGQDMTALTVKYEVALMSPDVLFNTDQQIKYNKDENKTLTYTDTSFQSQTTFQQYILYTVAGNSGGFMVRYTVASSANLISLFVSFAISIIYLF